MNSFIVCTLFAVCVLGLDTDQDAPVNIEQRLLQMQLEVQKLQAEQIELIDILGPLPDYYAEQLPRPSAPEGDSSYVISMGLKSTPAGNHSIEQSGYQLPVFPCGDGTFGDGSVVIYYPELDGVQKYPIVSMMHGSGNGFFGDLCYNIASLGIVVVAVRRGVCGDMTSQQLHAVFGSQQNQELHPALKMVDYGSVGVIGHSMGGAWSMNTATLAANYSIKAAVASHGFSGDAATKIPSDLPLMLVTGTGDPKRRFGWYAYNDTPARPKIFVNVYGDNHMAPAHGAPVNTMMAHFLGCYLIPNRDSCEIIYGDSDDSMCKALSMHDCDIQRT